MNEPGTLVDESLSEERMKEFEDLIVDAGLRMSFDRERDITKPCFRCKRSDVSRDLVVVGYWSVDVYGGMRAGDPIRRPMCAECAPKENGEEKPVVDDFWRGTRTEMAHQVRRWGETHDERKTPADWFWLLGYLGGKALTAHLAGNVEKALHHCISSAAVLGHWHAAIKNKLGASLKVEHDPSRAAGEALASEDVAP